ncbi:hypothetical protein GCM10025867_50810 (plasmid) [Frondihabitans sucicola]|uniref:DUF222 domain-containing protein n=1 Tax=Frondihabitans sucicola TaxID=1268041 RepID=A0ABN6Y680_9MICO|nr:hypothetical protein [Frondihabitans sucicola]BDZ52840.1 hypothetical protein GCM10025867_50810 [Frondihabitans sucicola]
MADIGTRGNVDDKQQVDDVAAADALGEKYLIDSWPGATLRTRYILFEALQGRMALSTEDPDLWLKNQRRRFGKTETHETPIFNTVIPGWRTLDAERLDAAWFERHGKRWPADRGPAMHLFDDNDRRRLRFALAGELERRVSDWAAWLESMRSREQSDPLSAAQVAVLDDVMPRWRTEDAASLDAAARKRLKRRKKVPAPPLRSGETRGELGFTETQEYYLDLARRSMLQVAGRAASTWLSRMRTMEAKAELHPEQIAALDAVIPLWRSEGVMTLDRLSKRALKPSDQKHVDLALRARLFEEGGRASASWLERLRLRDAEGSSSTGRRACSIRPCPDGAPRRRSHSISLGCAAGASRPSSHPARERDKACRRHCRIRDDDHLADHPLAERDACD